MTSWKKCEEDCKGQKENDSTSILFIDVLPNDVKRRLRAYLVHAGENNYNVFAPNPSLLVFRAYRVPS